MKEETVICANWRGIPLGIGVFFKLRKSAKKGYPFLVFFVEEH